MILTSLIKYAFIQGVLVRGFQDGLKSNTKIMYINLVRK